MAIQPPMSRWEKRKVTEYRDGAVFKTAHDSYIWVPLGEGRPSEPGYVFSPTGETHYSTIPHPKYPN